MCALDTHGGAEGGFFLDSVPVTTAPSPLIRSFRACVALSLSACVSHPRARGDFSLVSAHISFPLFITTFLSPHAKHTMSALKKNFEHVEQSWSLYGPPVFETIDIALHCIVLHDLISSVFVISYHIMSRYMFHSARKRTIARRPAISPATTRQIRRKHAEISSNTRQTHRDYTANIHGDQYKDTAKTPQRHGDQFEHTANTRIRVLHPSAKEYAPRSEEW